MNDEERQAVAAALVAAETSGTPTEPLSSAHADATVEDAYDIAMRVRDLKLGAGRRIKGHKVGLTSKVMRDMFEATEPDFGYLFDDWFIAEGATVPMSSLIRPLVEVELAFVLGDELAGPGATAADVIRATDVVLPAIEIVDTRYSERGPNMLVDSISDAASCGLVVLGSCPRKLTDIDLRTIGGSMAINAEVIESGMAAAVMGSPVNAVAWLANKLSEFGVTMEPGHVILSGSFVKAIPFGPGDTLTATFTEFGEVSFHTA